MVEVTVAPHTIILKGDKSRYEEGRAGGTIKPGHLIAKTSTDTLVVHPTSGGVAERAFAIEDGYQGHTIADSYLVTELVRYHLAVPGDCIYAWLKAGENVVKGDNAISGGDGTLIKTTGTPLTYIGKFDEALDLSGGGAVTTRIKVRII